MLVHICLVTLDACKRRNFSVKIALDSILVERRLCQHWRVVGSDKGHELALSVDALFLKHFVISPFI